VRLNNETPPVSTGFFHKGVIITVRKKEYFNYLRMAPAFMAVLILFLTTLFPGVAFAFALKAGAKDTLDLI
jgi:hypothetical protein